MRLLLSVLLCLSALQGVHAQDIRLLGFSDVTYLTTEREVPEGFLEGQLVGHLAAALTERLAFFSEATATARPTGYSFEVERLILRYYFEDYFKLSVGRYHTPVSYWNTAYHHGTWLHTSVARPEVIKFGSRFLPVHFVGLLAEGIFPQTLLGVGYVAGLGNGRHENIARAGDAGDINDHRAWLVGLTLRPARLFGLQAGAALYRDRVETGVASVDESIYSVHVVWEKERPELLAEVAWVAHDAGLAGGAGRTLSTGYYVQGGYRLWGALNVLKPYARWERLDAATGDLVFGPLGLGYEGAILGVRYDFSPLAALKGEYRSERFEDSERFHGLYLQVGFTFPGTFE